MAPLEAQRETRAALSRFRLPADDGHRANVLALCKCHTAGVYFKVCVSYVDYIEDTTGDNASTTKRKAHAGYIKDTQFRTVDKCRSVAVRGRQAPERR
jgi:hypothetical protein